MFNYILLNTGFMLLAAGSVYGCTRGLNRQKLLFTVLLLVVLTALFDQLIIRTHIVMYDYSQLVGLKIGAVPIEDFCYAITAAVLVPALYKRLTRGR